jgi:hypothetical protein
VYDFINSAVQLSESTGEEVKDSTLDSLKSLCEDLMGITRVDEKFMKQLVKDIACEK